MVTKLDLIRTYFLNREDVVATLNSGNGKPCPILTDEHIDKVIRAHLGEVTHKARNRVAALEGRHSVLPVLRIGSYAPGPDGRTRWLCVDFDGAGHAHALRSPQSAAEMMMHRCAEAEIPAYLERSGSGRGWHVWIFFERPLRSSAARALGLSLVPRGVEKIDGGIAEPEKHRGIEVFPKIAQHTGEELGHMLWLPWWHGAPAEANEFHRLSPEGPIPYVPTEFAMATVEKARAFVDANPPPAIAESEAPKATPRPPAQRHDDWDAWKSEMMERVPLDRVYRLTGKRDGRGWLEARDPSSDSGDMHPSASVSDGRDGRQRGLFYSHISQESLNPIDYLIKYEGAIDFLDACRTLADLSGVALPAPRGTLQHSFPETPAEATIGDNAETIPLDDEEPPPPQDEDAPPDLIERPGRKELNVKEDELELATAAWSAVVDVPIEKQRLFLWNDELVEIVRRKDGTIIQKIVTTGALRLRIAEHVAWVRYVVTGRSASGFEAKPAHAPGTLISAMRDSPDRRLPEIVTISTVPIYAPDGRLVHARGFDQQSGIFCWPTCDVPAIPDVPDDEDLARAHSWIFGKLLHDFPFARPSDKAHAVAALLTPLVRLLIAGPTPLFLFESPTQGSGKGRIPLVASIISTGTAKTMTLSQNDDENEKKFLAFLKDCPTRIMFIDNVDINIRSSMLAQTLTSTHIEGRILGLSQGVTARNLATWMLTANNPDSSKDIRRRALAVRLDPQMEHPDQRAAEEFVVPHLVSWAQENRGILAWSLLTMVQHWIATGAKKCPLSLGSFEEFASIVGGILAANGVEGFLQNRGANDTADHDEWRAIVAVWHGAFKGETATARDILQLVVEHKLECSALSRSGERAQLTAFGTALRRQADRIINGYKIVRENDGWRLTQMEARRPVERVREPGEDDDIETRYQPEVWDFRN